MHVNLRALLSKVRRVTGPEALGLRSRFQLELPADAWIDVEAATQAIHRSEAAVSAADWPRAWAASHGALCTARREFMVGEDAFWIQQWRRQLEDVEARALECYAAAALGMGPSELPAAERAARGLIGKEAYRESGYRLLMEVLAAEGNDAEATSLTEKGLPGSRSSPSRSSRPRLSWGVRRVTPHHERELHDAYDARLDADSVRETRGGSLAFG